jgi:hypothetical protein
MNTKQKPITTSLGTGIEACRQVASQGSNFFSLKDRETAEVAFIGSPEAVLITWPGRDPAKRYRFQLWRPGSGVQQWDASKRFFEAFDREYREANAEGADINQQLFEIERIGSDMSTIYKLKHLRPLNDEEIAERAEHLQDARPDGE